MRVFVKGKGGPMREGRGLKACKVFLPFLLRCQERYCLVFRPQRLVDITFYPGSRGREPRFAM